MFLPVETLIDIAREGWHTQVFLTGQQGNLLGRVDPALMQDVFYQLISVHVDDSRSLLVRDQPVLCAQPLARRGVCGVQPLVKILAR
jgi:hypothetical protein